MFNFEQVNTDWDSAFVSECFPKLNKRFKSQSKVVRLVDPQTLGKIVSSFVN